MGRPILFSKAILITAFLPIFTFQRVEAKIFSPMAYTLSFALLGSLIVTLTLIPVLLSYLLGPRLAEKHNPLVHWMEQRYGRALAWVLDQPRKMLVASVSALLLALASMHWIGTEFMPKLDEGNIWLTITLPTPISRSKAKQIEQDVRSRVAEFDEVKSVLTQLGRPEDGTDPKGYNNLEVLVDLQPKETWRYSDKDELVKAMNAKLEIFPGIQLNFSQVIQDNVEEAISGVKGEIAVKIFGDDLKVLQEKANQVTDILKKTRGATDVAAEQQAGLAQMLVRIDRDKISRYGLTLRTSSGSSRSASAARPPPKCLRGRAVSTFPCGWPAKRAARWRTWKTSPSPLPTAPASPWPNWRTSKSTRALPASAARTTCAASPSSAT